MNGGVGWGKDSIYSMASRGARRSLKNSKSVSMSCLVESVLSWTGRPLLLPLLLLVATETGRTGKRRLLRGEEGISSVSGADALPLLTAPLFMLLRNARTSDTKGTTERYRPERREKDGAKRRLHEMKNFVDKI
jgi:hypothetical protein